MSKVDRIVLPNFPKPSHYKLTIEPDLEKFTFKGEVEIELYNQHETKEIVLNAIELDFLKVTLTNKTQPSTQTIDPKLVTFDTNLQRATIPLASPIPGNTEIVLTIVYTGIIGDKLCGFYRSKYTVDGKEAYMGTTQFEAVDARRALPCWDEPSVKAAFQVIIIAPANLIALSNMPHSKKEKIKDGKFTRWEFPDTPVMSTYLLAWTIGVFECIERTIQKVHKSHTGAVEETLVRVFTPEGKKNQGNFALDVACRVLPLYEKFFSINYVLPKLDLLAIPDFAAGAMENWGLVTYREVALLCDETSSAAHRQNVAIVVAHELAHQWFGNLVTMKWWSELWLNESFATYMEYWAVNKLFPEWQVNTQFVHDECMRAFDLDALRSSHPVEVDVANAQEIDDIFDAISYSKGGSVVRMVVEFIGEEAFQKGMSEYLKHFMFSNASTVHLWHHLGQAAGKDLAPLLENWTAKQGYPYLTVSSSADKMTLNATQHRFLATGDVKPEEDQTVWSILLCLATGANSVQSVVMNTKTATFDIPHTDGFVKVNYGQTAFCRVLYKDANLLKSLITAVESKSISNIDRLSIISDYHAFARSGLCSGVEVLELMKHYKNEDDYTVWCAVIDCETDIRIVVETEGPACLDAYNAFCIDLYQPAMEKLGYAPKSTDDHRALQLRGALFARLCACGHAPSMDAALAMYHNRATNPISSDLRQTVFAVHLKKGGRPELEEVMRLAEVATEANERAQLLRALAASSVDGLSHTLIEFALSSRVRTQDAFYVLMGLASGTSTKPHYAEDVIRYWKDFSAKFHGFILGRTLKFLSFIADAATGERMRKFWNGLSQEQRMGMTRSFEQGMEGLESNTAWASRDGKKVAAFLSR